MSEGTLGDLTGLLNQEPFMPFQLILTSGTTYPVFDPVQLVPRESRFTYYCARSDRLAIFRINQIVTMETLAA
jgi:hypothetical protein